MGDDYDRSIHTNPNALTWAEFFSKTFPNCNVPVDVMHTWFANAMMAMHDCIRSEEMSSSHKDIPEYDEELKCENPECKHLEASVIVGLYGIAGGGGSGVYSVCEHCGTVLSKSIDPEMCDTHEVREDDEPPKDSPEYPKWVELKAQQLRGEPDVKDDTESGTDLDK